MYKCLICGNIKEFEEINVVKTYVKQDEKGEINYSGKDEFFYRENVVCLECGNTLDDGNIEEIIH